MLELIRILLQVLASGSFSKAGIVLHMAPSSVARSIDNLEHQLGVTLLHRSTRQLRLTEEGEHFVEQASLLLEDADNLVAALRQNSREISGTLRISVFESFGSQIISPMLAPFLQRYPNANIEINLDNRMVDLTREKIDLAIRIGRPADSGLRARHLMPNRTQLYAAPDYLTHYGMPQTPEEVSQHNCLLLSQDRQRNYWHFSRGRTHHRIPVQGNLSSKGGTPLLRAAEHGAGLLLLSSWMTQDLVKAGKLVICLPEWQVSQYEDGSGEIYAVYPGGKYPKPLLRAFIDFMVEQLKAAH